MQLPAGSGAALPQPDLRRARGPHRHLALDRAALRPRPCRASPGESSEMVREAGHPRPGRRRSKAGLRQRRTRPKGACVSTFRSRRRRARSLTSGHQTLGPLRAGSRPGPAGRPHPRRPRRAPGGLRRGHPWRARFQAEERRMSGRSRAAGRIQRGEEGWPDCLAELPAVDEKEPDVLYGLGEREALSPRSIRIAPSRSSAPAARAHTGARWRASSGSAPHRPASLS